MNRRNQTNWFVLIPIVLNVAALLIMPRVIAENSLDSAVVVGVAALGAPWLLFFIISRVIDHLVDRARRGDEEAEHVDFV